MKLSICMMIKNESRWLEQCLKSLQPLRDAVESELIIVDTGSTDGSIEIAEKFTEKLYFHEWNENFAEMRNITINYAKGEWLFIIDGDEVVEDATDLIDFLKSKRSEEYAGVIVDIKNYTREEDWSKFTIAKIARVFKRTPEFHYKGAVHNIPVSEGNAYTSNTVLKHYGYLASNKELMDRKFFRTAGILKRELDKDPENIYYWYQLSVSYSMHSDNEEAIPPIERAYDLCRSKKIDLQQYLYVFSHLALMYIKVRHYADAERICLEVKGFWQHSLDIQFYLAESQAKQNKNELALENYLLFLNMLERYDELEKGGEFADYSLGQVNFVRMEICRLLTLQQGNEAQALAIVGEINEPIADVNEVIHIIIKLNCDIHRYSELYEYYQHSVLQRYPELSALFQEILFQQSEKLSGEEKLALADVFAHGDDFYSIYWKWKKYNLRKENLPLSLVNQIQQLDWRMLPKFFADILYDQFEYMDACFTRASEAAIQRWFEYLTNKYSDFADKVIKYLKNSCEGNTLKSLQLQRIFSRYVLVLLPQNHLEYTFVLQRYFMSGVMEIKAIYRTEILEEGVLKESPYREHAFLAHLYFAEQALENKNTALFLDSLKQAVATQPEMQPHLQAWALLLKPYFTQHLSDEERIASLLGQGKYASALIEYKKARAKVEYDIAERNMIDVKINEMMKKYKKEIEKEKKENRFWAKLEKIETVLFVEAELSKNTNALAGLLTEYGIKVDLAYLGTNPAFLYGRNELPYRKIVGFKKVDSIEEYANIYHYDIVQVANSEKHIASALKGLEAQLFFEDDVENCGLNIEKIVAIYSGKLKKKSSDANKKNTKNLPCSSEKALTILIPTYNRAKYLKRVLKFFDDYKDKNFDIVIVDSSNKEFKEENKMTCETFTNLSIHYMQFDSETNFFVKVNAGLQEVKTEFICLCADDDFIDEEGCKKAVEILKKEDDLFTVKGKNLYYIETMAKLQEYDFFAGSYEDDVISRFEKVVEGFVPSLIYQVFRADGFKKMYGFWTEYKNELPLNPTFQEYLLYFMVLLTGKAGKIDIDFNIRDKGVPRENHVENFPHALIDKSFNQNYQMFKAFLVKYGNTMGISGSGLEENMDATFSSFLMNFLQVPQENICWNEVGFDLEKLEAGMRKSWVWPHS